MKVLDDRQGLKQREIVFKKGVGERNGVEPQLDCFSH